MSSPISINGLKFLNLAKNDNALRESLSSKDFSAIDAFPDLTEGDKNYLKAWHWGTLRIHVDDDAIAAFQPRVSS